MKKAIPVIVGLVALVAVVRLVLPHLAQPTGSHPAQRDGNHLKQIGLAIKMYAGDHEENFPADFSELSRYVAGQTKVFVTQAHGAKAGAWSNVMEWTDYVYIRGLSEASRPDAVVAFLPPGHHMSGDEPVAIALFVDGHTEMMTTEQLTRALNRGPNKALLSDAVNRARER